MILIKISNNINQSLVLSQKVHRRHFHLIDLIDADHSIEDHLIAVLLHRNIQIVLHQGLDVALAKEQGVNLDPVAAGCYFMDLADFVPGSSAA